MGFWDFLFGGGRRYKNLLAWAERRVGRLDQGMSPGQIDSYVMRISTADTGKKISQNTLEGLKRYLRTKYGAQ